MILLRTTYSLSLEGLCLDNILSNQTQNTPYLHMKKNAGQTWVQFIAGGDEHLLYRIAQRDSVRLSRYKIDYVIDVVGRRPTNLVAGVSMIRIESDGPIEQGEVERKSTIPTIALHGI